MRGELEGGAFALGAWGGGGVARTYSYQPRKAVRSEQRHTKKALEGKRSLA